MINILIVEDNREVRLSLVNILKIDPGIRIIGEAGDGLEAVESAKKFLPDLILMDIKLPGLDGLEAAKQIKAFCASSGRDMKVLILSTFYDDDYVLKSHEYGVDGYLLKGMAFDKLASTVKNTCNGLVTLDRIVYEKKNRLRVDNSYYAGKLAALTKTELKILELIVNGKKNAEIAAELFFAEGTVRNYISSMLSKLDCKNGRDLAVFGIKAGL